MWSALLLFAILLPILILATVATFLWTAVLLLRRRTLDVRLSFTTVVLAYLALMMLIGGFVTASGVGMVGKVALVEATRTDFGYNPATQFRGLDTGPGTRPLTPSEVSDKKNTDATLGAALLIVGLIMLLPHAVAFVTLRGRGARGAGPVFRAYSLLGLATATIGFLSAGGTALGETLHRAANGDSGWQGHAIAEPLAFAVVLLPVSAWFGYQLWTQVTADIATEQPAAATGAIDPT